MKVLLADDEPLARTRMLSLLAQCEDIDVIGSVGDAEAALAQCEASHPDLLLLDIRMPGLDGLQLARRLACLPRPPQVVFCTAYEAHAVDAYAVRATDYLLKPVRLERLRGALDRVRDMLATQSRAPREYLHARLGSEQTRVALDDVFYLVADEKYVSAHHAGGQLLLEDSLKSLEQQFPERLLRLHRNCLLPRERLLGLKALADGRVLARLTGCDALHEVSRRNVAGLRKWLREV
ncbi:MAG: LytTR family DNA-binding domain-containing protein [Xanthomonadales bacterium]|nr:LytTR family DNA-binding domain-containing protein [Xanthomonadales bacterium]